MAYLLMPSLNKNKDNYVNSLLVHNIVREIAYCINNILIINNIDHLK